PTEKALMFALGWLDRRLNSAATALLRADRPPPRGSWPDYGWYAQNSPTLKELWKSATLQERERMRLIAGSDHWLCPGARWRDDGQYLFRLLTLLCHWRECDRRRERAGLTAVTT